MTTYLFSRFFSGDEHVDPNLFSRLQLYIAAHPDTETSCVLANLFRALYTNGELFFIESLQRLDAASQNVARELMHAKASNAFPKAVWENALALIAALPVERGGYGKLAAKVPPAFTEASANADPAMGSQAWLRAWGLYFKWGLRRSASRAFTFAARRGGFDNFKYLWGASAAAGVLAASFGVVLLDEHLGIRSIIASSPPIAWIADLVGIEQESEPLAETKLKNAVIERLAQESSRKAVRIQPEMPQSDDSAAAARAEEPVQIALEETVAVSDPAPAPTAIPDEGALGRLAPADLSSRQERPKPNVVPREGNRPETQTRPKPVALLQPAVAIVPAAPVAPLLVSNPPLPAKLVETTLPVIDTVEQNLPKSPLLEELPVKATEPQHANEIQAAASASARGQSANSSENGTPAATAFIQLLQSGGRDERKGKDDAREKQASERRGELVESVNRNRPGDSVEQLDRSGPSDRVERIDRSGPVNRVERAERVERSGSGDRIERVERIERIDRIDRSGPSARPDRVERIERPGPSARLERIERIDRAGPSYRLDRFERLDRSGRNRRGG